MTTHCRGRRSHWALRIAPIGPIAALAAVIALPTGALASTAPGLGTATSFAVLAGTPAVTNTGVTVISGSVGVSPAAAVTGFPPGAVTNGSIEAATPAAASAKSDLTTAYGVAASSPCNFDKTGTNLGGLTLTPGTYCQTTAPTLTGTLTLSGDGVFIFQSGSTLVTAPGSSVVLTNGAQACNVYWQVSSSATIDTTTTFVGTIMALTDITVNDGANITGRALAQNGQVTLIHDTITAPTACTAATVAGPTTGPAPSPSAQPSPSPPGGPGTPNTGIGGNAVGHAAELTLIGITLVAVSAGAGINARRRRRAASIHRIR